jgi:hypothetical protein
MRAQALAPRARPALVPPSGRRRQARAPPHRTDFSISGRNTAMRALTRYALAPLFVAAAFLTAGAPAHASAATAATHQVRYVPQIYCPGGTSWDNILHICR